MAEKDSRESKLLTEIGEWERELAKLGGDVSAARADSICEPSTRSSLRNKLFRTSKRGTDSKDKDKDKASETLVEEEGENEELPNLEPPSPAAAVISSSSGSAANDNGAAAADAGLPTSSRGPSSASAVQLHSVQLQGWVTKMGYRTANWKRRWAVLRGVVVEYYAEKPERVGCKPKGLFALGFTASSASPPTCSQVVPADVDMLIDQSASAIATVKRRLPNVQFCVCIRNAICNKKLRTYYLACDNPVDQDTWIAALRCNLAVYRCAAATRDLYRAMCSRTLRALYTQDQESQLQEAIDSRESAEFPPLELLVPFSVWMREILRRPRDFEQVVLAHYSGVDVCMEDSPTGSALSHAATNGNIIAIQYLILHGANANHAASDTLETALHAAARAEQAHSVRTLLRWGANPALKNVENKKPIDLCKVPQIVSLLMEEETPFSSQDQDSKFSIPALQPLHTTFTRSRDTDVPLEPQVAALLPANSELGSALLHALNAAVKEQIK
eukprot:m.271699 g.271699  ORF g.271699 m.271699 type:complete len:502 (-) comp22838_c10_seq1:65-1570(-)